MHHRTRPSLAALSRAPLWAAFFVAVPASAQQPGTPAYERQEAAVYAASAGQALGRASMSDHAQVVAAALRARGRDESSVAALRDAGMALGARGMTHRRFEQSVDGFAVHGAYAKAAFNARGELVHLIDHLAAVPPRTPAAPRVGALVALRAAMQQVHPTASAQFRSLGRQGHSERFDGGAFFHEAPKVTEVVIPLADGSLSRGYLVQTWTRRQNLLDHTLVDGNGRVLDVERRTANDSYNVFAVDPVKTPQATVAGPGAGNAESPQGWLAGPQTTTTISGNNVSAYLDTNADNAADSGGDAVVGGVFLTGANLVQSPDSGTNRAVAVQNLFYLNNRVHDILYRHGFTEAAGNFQVDNFGKGGIGADPVDAEAQDGSGTDNANFATPPDGSRPRMQMYLWTGAGATHEVVAGGVVYDAMGAAFGATLSATGLGGLLAAASPADGCTRIGAAVNGKIALVDRGNCNFTDKVLNAQSAGALGVIVINNASGPSFPMGGSNKRIVIPSVMVSQGDGTSLRAITTPATMRTKATQPLQRDGDLDSDVVYHEYGHGLTWRMIGGMSGPMAGAIGEGMSDGVAMLINGDDAIGEYAASSPDGIRRNRYAGYPRTYGSVTGSEVHDDGEVYAAIVWRLMELYGPGAARDRLFAQLVDGMNYTPSKPTFEAMRDGILQAVAGSATPGDRCTVWSAFAQFGVGVNATGKVKGKSVSVLESFAKPGDCP